MAELKLLEDRFKNEKLKERLLTLDRNLEKNISLLSVKEEKARAWKSIVNIYWEVCELIIENVVEENSEFRANYLNGLEKAILNYGYLDSRLSSTLANHLTDFNKKFSKPHKLGKIEVMTLDFKLERSYEEIVGYPELFKKKAELDEVVEELKGINDALLKIIAQLKHFAGKLVEKLVKAKTVATALRVKLNSGKPLTPEERQNLLSMEEEVEFLRAQIEDILKQKLGDNGKTIMMKYSDLLEKRFKVEDELRIRNSIYERKKEEIENYPTRKKVEKLILYYRSLRENIRHEPILTAWGEEVDLLKIVNLWKHITMWDTRVVSHRYIRSSEYVPFCIIPGCSRYGTYFYEDKVFLMPVVAERSVVEALAASIADFHWYTDEDYSLRNALQGLSKELARASFTKLRKEWHNLYNLWIVKESNGYKVLEKKERNLLKVLLKPLGKKKLQEEQEKRKNESLNVNKPKEESKNDSGNSEMEKLNKLKESYFKVFNDSKNLVIQLITKTVGTETITDRIDIQIKWKVDKPVLNFSLNEVKIEELERIAAILPKIVEVWKKLFSNVKGG